LESGQSILETQLLAEQASSLGRMGAEVETALGCLKASSAIVGSDEHEALIKRAAEAVWYLMIQRDVCGIHDHRAIVEHYNIPPIVLRRIGARS